MVTRRRIGGGLCALALCLLGVAAPGFPLRAGIAAAQPVAAPAIAAGTARVWFIRLYQPYVSLATPMLFINGAPLTPSLPGSVFYRDLPPGTYTFSVASYGIDYGQAQTLPLYGREELYFLIFCDPDWASGTSYKRDTFYVLPIPPPLAWQYMRMPDMRDLGAR